MELPPQHRRRLLLQIVENVGLAKFLRIYRACPILTESVPALVVLGFWIALTFRAWVLDHFDLSLFRSRLLLGYVAAVNRVTACAASSAKSLLPALACFIFSCFSNFCVGRWFCIPRWNCFTLTHRNMCGSMQMNESSMHTAILHSSPKVQRKQWSKQRLR